jgi:hypothetical protein
MFTKAMLKSALASIVVLAAVKKFAPLSIKKYL